MAERAQRLDVAIAGCGWAATWQVRDGFSLLPDRFRVVACCDADPGRARAFAASHGIPRVVADYDALLGLPGIDVISVCTPPTLHCAMVVAALQAGRHVVCEKPFVASLAEHDRVVAAAAASPGRVMPIFQYRFGDGIARVRHAIRSGLAGRHYLSTVETAKTRGPDYYAVPWRGRFATELGGVLLTQAIHNHDLLTWLVGPPALVSCMKATRVNPVEVEDCAVATLRLADGSLAALAATLGAARQSTRFHLEFEHVTFEKACFAEDSRHPADEPWTVVPKGDDVGRALAATMAVVPSQRGWFARQFELFHGALGDGGELPVTLADARTALELVTALFHADETGQAVALPIAPGHPKYAGWIPAKTRAAA